MTVIMQTGNNNLFICLGGIFIMLFSKGKKKSLFGTMERIYIRRIGIYGYR